MPRPPLRNPAQRRGAAGNQAAGPCRLATSMPTEVLQKSPIDWTASSEDSAAPPKAVPSAKSEPELSAPVGRDSEPVAAGRVVPPDSARTTAQPFAQKICAQDVPASDDPRMVLLTVYDLTNMRLIQAFNDATLPLGAGVFHVGIKVWNKEYNFGFRTMGSGVSIQGDDENPGHRFRTCVPLGCTMLSEKEVDLCARQLAKTWPGTAYDALRLNCTHFARAFAQKLGVSPPPGWVDFLSRTAHDMTSTIEVPLSSLSMSFKVRAATACPVELKEEF